MKNTIKTLKAACGISSKNPSRLALTALSFQNGIAYATDSYCLLKYSNDNLKGISGNYEALGFSKLAVLDSVTDILEKTPVIDAEFPNCETILTAQESKLEIGINLLYLEKLIKVFKAHGTTNVIFKFSDAKNPLKIVDLDESKTELTGLIMPLKA